MATGQRARMMEETRARLVRAARSAFAEKGYAAASMDELTAAAGLTRGALYHNFGQTNYAIACAHICKHVFDFFRLLEIYHPTFLAPDRFREEPA